jgi:transposase
MAPLVRRTLAPCGRTPALPHRAKHREKVSLAAALTFAPGKGLGLYFRTYPGTYIKNVQTVGFLKGLLKEIPGRILLVCDRGNMHKGPPIREFLARHPRLTLHHLPPYAPDLNPVELLWSYLKYGRMANHAPYDLKELHRLALKHLFHAQRNPRLLASFWHWSQLTLPRGI